MSKAIFIYNGYQTIISCSKDDKIKNICSKFASRKSIDINSLIFIYENKEIDLELKFQKLPNIIDKEIDIRIILVFNKEKNEIKCPKCGKKIINDKSDNIIKYTFTQIDMLNKIKYELTQTSLSNEINEIKEKIKNINIMINNIIKECEKNKNNINRPDNNTFNRNYKYIIKGTIKVEDIYRDVEIFNQLFKNEGFDVYFNNEKVELIKSYKILYKNFHYEKGSFDFQIKFYEKLPTLERLFQNCSDLISLDLSEYDTAGYTSMAGMFNGCHRLKEIIGMDKFKTIKVKNMVAMFQECNEIECLNLSSFNTSNTTNMGWMFYKCYKLKEIIGINNFDTSKVNNMRAMFAKCSEMIYLDLSNFNTLNVDDFGWMFHKCSNLKKLNILNFKLKNNCNTANIFDFEYKFKFSKDCYTQNLFQIEYTNKFEIITNNKNLKKLYININFD